jgi:uncharacterized protein
MLDLRPNCERCDADLPPDSAEARICTYECTFCARCVDGVLRNVCPNCGGGFQPRPIRPAHAWRAGTGLAHDPAVGRRRRTRYDDAELAAFAARLAGVPPHER